MAVNVDELNSKVAAKLRELQAEEKQAIDKPSLDDIIKKSNEIKKYTSVQISAINAEDYVAAIRNIDKFIIMVRAFLDGEFASLMPLTNRELLENEGKKRVPQFASRNYPTKIIADIVDKEKDYSLTRPEPGTIIHGYLEIFKALKIVLGIQLEINKMLSKPVVTKQQTLGADNEKKLSTPMRERLKTLQKTRLFSTKESPTFSKPVSPMKFAHSPATRARNKEKISKMFQPMGDIKKQSPAVKKLDLKKVGGVKGLEGMLQLKRRAPMSIEPVALSFNVAPAMIASSNSIDKEVLEKKLMDKTIATIHASNMVEEVKFLLACAKDIFVTQEKNNDFQIFIDVMCKRIAENKFEKEGDLIDFVKIKRLFGDFPYFLLKYNAPIVAGLQRRNEETVSNRVMTLDSTGGRVMTEENRATALIFSGATTGKIVGSEAAAVKAPVVSTTVSTVNQTLDRLRNLNL